ncbi:MAG: GNAT family N-acetyltransferase [Candidatus Thermoplasmatota archaeon]|nr:GNAT family N-acetyltransferase [Candidatus Thermoplasmatota archaeon]
MKSGSKDRTGRLLEDGFEYRPLTPGLWEDLETLFGKSGAWGGCWCMWWRLSAAEFEKQRGAQNKSTMRDIVDENRVPGILLYKEGTPVGWCSIAPRDEFPRLNRSPLLKPVDEEPVLSIVCFYVARAFRRQGITGKLLEAALAYAREQGAQIVEGYPLDTDRKDYPAPSAWTGFLPTFEAAGFNEVLRRKVTRPIVRYRWDPARSDPDGSP